MSRAAGILACACALAVLVLAAVLGHYAHPQVDDLFRAARVRDLGVTGSVVLEYKTWSGRWLGTGLSYALSSRVDVRHCYGFLLAAVALASLSATCLLVRGVLTNGPWRLAIAFGSILYALLWTGLSDPGDSFYWLTGAIENQFAIALGLALFGWLLLMPARAGGSAIRAARLAGVAVAAFALPGIHELYGAILLAALCVGALTASARRDARRAEWWLAVAGCVAGMAVVVFAPGNGVRMSEMPMRRSPATLLRLVHLVPVLAGWIASPQLLAASGAFVLHPAVRRLRAPWTVSNIPWRWLIPAGTLAAEIFGFGACYWLVGGVPPRTFSALYRLFLIGWFATLFAWAARAGAGREPSSRERSVWQICTLALAIALLQAPTTLRAWDDLRWRARAYDEALRTRDRFLEAADDLHAGVPALPTSPVLFFHADVVNAPRDYRNFHYVMFYRLKSLQVDFVTGPEEPFSKAPSRGPGPEPPRSWPLSSLRTADDDSLASAEGVTRIVFRAPPGVSTAVLRLRAVSSISTQTLEARVNRVPVFVHRFQAAGEWHAFLSKAFTLRAGDNQLALRSTPQVPEPGQPPPVRFGDMVLESP